MLLKSNIEANNITIFCQKTFNYHKSRDFSFGPGSESLNRI